MLPGDLNSVESNTFIHKANHACTPQPPQAKIGADILSSLPAESILILIFGRPGAGKTTLAQQLVSLKFNHVHIGMGQILRDLSQKREDLKYYFSNGILIPDSLAIFLIRQTLKPHFPLNKSIVLEGHPQTLRQYEFLIQFLQKHKIKPIGLFMDTPSEICHHRCLQRARRDDSLSILNRRFSNFEETILPVIRRAQNDFFVLIIKETL